MNYAQHVSLHFSQRSAGWQHALQGLMIFVECFCQKKWTSAACRPMSTTVRHGFVRVGPSDGSKIPASKSCAAEVGRYELSENEKCEKYRPFYSNHLLIFSKNLFWCFCIFSISSLTRCWDLYEDSLALWQNKKTLANQWKQSHLPEYNHLQHIKNHQKWPQRKPLKNLGNPCRFPLNGCLLIFSMGKFLVQISEVFTLNGNTGLPSVVPTYMNAVDWENRRQDWWQIKHSWLSVDT